MPHDGWHPHDHPHHHAHERPTRRLVLAAATFLPFGGASAQSADAQQRIADQATRLLALLDDRQRRQVLIGFGRPVTATLAGAPAMPFTTWGISPQRDGIVIGLGANTAIADATSVYLRYEGNISGQDSAHAITA